MGINVLSLFDGMACGLVALKRSGISVDNYFASEIDKYAIKIAKKNHPEIIHLGDVQTLDLESLPKIDLLIGGSPCQGFSNAGRGENFDDPRSKLFFEYVKIYKALKKKNPDLEFLLENVKMKQEWQNIISGYMGVEPIKINSALVSAQNRVRLYWTNISGVTQPEDKHIYLKAIIEYGEVDREKSYTIDANYFKGGNPRSYFEDGKRQLVFADLPLKSKTVRSSGRGSKDRHEWDMIKLKTISHGYILEKENVVNKYPSLCAQSPDSKHKIALQDEHYRKLTPLECERLQTLPDNYTDGVSNTQRYKMLGNGWTVDVISHIFSFLPKRFFVK